MNKKQEDRGNANRNENDEIKERCGAYHEAGHMVAAAIRGLRLRSEGLMIDRRGWGLACYYREPEDSDVWREAVVIASLAGFKAENELRRRSSFALRDAQEMIDSCDWREARPLVAKFSEGRFISDNVGTLLRKFEDQAERLVVEWWPANRGTCGRAAPKGVGGAEAVEERRLVVAPGRTDREISPRFGSRQNFGRTRNCGDVRLKPFEGRECHVAAAFGADIVSDWLRDRTKWLADSRVG